MHDAPRRPPIIYRPDLQPRPQRLLFSSLTALAWIGWLYLFLPLVSLLAWWFGVDLFARFILEPEDPAHLLTLLRYFGVVLIAAAVIIAWSSYNLRRFGGLDRRKTIPPVSDVELCARFDIEPELLDSLRASRRVVLGLDAEGQIEAVGTADSCASNQRLRQIPPPYPVSVPSEPITR
ncbi:poly-beta-1,6-N-acetyl-D-glucosamine biosynthesis protein PgaD [Wenzhouxiangella sp. XN24]|uniref:poly-beta-1,6-N-acetyl-D-glucosamine biosynthesis protein PgaD n=1 Tax=Wenzhouxiangella sp. XN24 TaxID=2713569 RepID=UPI0013EAF2A2|nr:poly-beta-1,6-N-acetyl-D-glucosamine biosynthesis protein PgaD [Wenzhouxiangella sp. XN24]NGX15435.1 poly-beta-1,6-N-acetyl-D-glucosamine biosynthesis protein PgaD [Wenzhouxiangella sp. XN24]